MRKKETRKRARALVVVLASLKEEGRRGRGGLRNATTTKNIYSYNRERERERERDLHNTR